MKILLVCHRYPPLGVAGVERLSAQTAEALRARGHQVTVLTRREGSSSALTIERWTQSGVPVVAIAGGAYRFEEFPVHEPALERVFERMLAELTPDVVLATHLLQHSPGYVDVAHRWRLPIVLELHDFFALCPRAHLQRVSGELCEGPEGGKACAEHCFGDQPQAQLRWALRSKSFAAAVRGADAVLAPSRYVAEVLAPRRAGGSPIEVLGNSVTPFGPVLRAARPDDAPLRFASIGVTVEHKGFEVAVEGLRLAGIPAEYTIFGLALNPGAKRLRKAAERAPHMELKLYGGFAPEHLPALLSEIDVLLVPSLVPETFSIVMREGFACGLPAIASRIGALPEGIRHGDNGWLFEPGDAVGLATLMQDLDGDRNRIRRSAAGILPSDVISVEQRTDRIEAILTEVAARARREDQPAQQVELATMREALASSG